ncbi:sorbosone dehydrogenase family protein [Pelagibacterium sp. 26DY04]|uniref:PQQ-dependent sugar dehydrogenase n=1 Tax=Pelagibacterium sp. 26DY04 TaxID=2967130 RepID=UPI0028161DEA|nr:sorbosone dehydrogenase family protein [Pelagibacterium sp. 26DY04]WMT88020.1 sorbosone dehydrogenase family protein [Pelagibacterium sp. 26DY04]
MSWLTALLVLVAVIVVAIGGGILWWNIRVKTRTPQFGTTPAIPEPQPQGAIPMLKMPTARGWQHGAKPEVATGLKVAAFAENLKHPRWIYVLPNGDVLVAESATIPRKVRGFMDYATNRTMKRAGATYPSANQITLLRDADGDGIPEVREIFLSGLHQPFGMALVGSTLYVGNSDSVVAFPYEEGQTSITAKGRTIFTMKDGGHWTRNLIASADGSKLYVAIGSLSNIADEGFEAEEGRACIVEIDLETEQNREFAGGLRNPVGMAWHDGKLWTVVNERDGLGDETPPDYLTSVRDGGFYGWPYAYWGDIVDDRVQPQRADLVEKTIAPDYALGGHTASLGLCWLDAGRLPGLPAGMVIGQHGSWNRSKLSGYKVILVPFQEGRPAGDPIDVLTGFLSADEKYSNGRPVGVTISGDGALLVADDVGHVVWRVTPA